MAESNPSIAVKKLCYVATLPAAVHAFLRPHITAAAGRYDVTVVCDGVDRHLLKGLPARLIFLPVERKPSPLHDLRTLFRLYRLFRRERFDIVHSLMPKTGLLAMLAGWLAGIPVRIHTFTGQVWVTSHGLGRHSLRWIDKLIGSLTTCTLVDGHSQRDFLVAQKVLSAAKAQVIGAGSVCGVDANRFKPDTAARTLVRSELGIKPDARLILYVGRLNRDKGMLDLAAAFCKVTHEIPEAELLLVGAEEEISFGQMQEICGVARERLHFVNFTSHPERYMAAADVFCLPSYREGFNMTLIEAAACGVPAVATRIYGIVDAVAENETGLLCPVADIDALSQSLIKLLQDNQLRLSLGNAAQRRTLDMFSGDAITYEMIKLYDELTLKKNAENFKD